MYFSYIILGEKMKNIINYYYGFNVVDVFFSDNKYYFNYDNNSYVFMIYDRKIEESKPIYKIYKQLKDKNIFTNDIIMNRKKQILTFINNIPYILIKDNTKNGTVSMNDIFYIHNNTISISDDKDIIRNDWSFMWKIKIDYYESQIKDFAYNYSLIGNTINYYIGLAENAISYLDYYKKNETHNYVLSHRNFFINNDLFSFYSPTNYILDSRVRDFAEYIKNQFFLSKMDFNMFMNYLDYMNFNVLEYIELISRLLFPTYYFDILDEIIIGNYKEEEIKKVLIKNNDYISFLKNTFCYILYNKKISIPLIEWIIKH